MRIPNKTTVIFIFFLQGGDPVAGIPDQGKVKLHVGCAI